MNELAGNTNVSDLRLSKLKNKKKLPSDTNPNAQNYKLWYKTMLRHNINYVDSAR